MNDLVEQPKFDPAKHFAAMAERIKLNEGQTFGGAVVVVPPENGGEPIEILMLDNQADLTQFYATITSRVQRSVNEVDVKQRQQQGFGRKY